MLKRFASISVDSFNCDCTLRTIHDLPCAYKLARYSQINGSIPLLSIHVHWKMLFINGTHNAGDSWGDLTLTNEVDALVKRFS